MALTSITNVIDDAAMSKPGDTNPLAVYLKSEGLNQTEFAERMTIVRRTMGDEYSQVSQSAVSMWATGERPPSRLTKMEIEKASGGKVPISAWPGTRRPKLSRNRDRFPKTA